MHKNILKNQIQSKCRYIEVSGMRIPVSPDGIPMVNMAQQIATDTTDKDDIETTPDRSVFCAQH